MQHKRKLINRFPDIKGIAYFEQCSFVFGKFFYFGVIFLGENPSLLVKEVILMKITINGTITALAAAVMLAGCGAVEESGIAGAAERQDQTQTETAAPVTEITAVTSAETEETQQADATLSAEILNDIRLWADKKEITADVDSGEVIWSCEIPAGFSPDKIRLVEAAQNAGLQGGDISKWREQAPTNGLL